MADGGGGGSSTQRESRKEGDVVFNSQAAAAAGGSSGIDEDVELLIRRHPKIFSNEPSLSVIGKGKKNA